MTQTEERLPKRSDPVILDDELWQRLLDLTHGAAAPCFQCGVCTASCPWSMVRERPISVRSLIRDAQLGSAQEEDTVWLCTACSQCEAYCPRGVPVVEVLRGLRYLHWERRTAPEGTPSVLWSVYWNENPWFQPPSQRTQWAKSLKVEEFDAEKHEILFYVGCTASFDRRAQRIAQGLVHLFQAAGIRFGTLGDDEPCCGESVLSLGHRRYFEDLAGKTADLFDQRSVRTLVTTSPHCFDVFRNEYPRLGGDFTALHYTDLLCDKIESGCLKFSKSAEFTVTFQDPCLLGRGNGSFDAPRQILKSIPGLEFREMPNHAEAALCCGGGGGRMWMETPPGERFGDLRVEEALGTGAQVLATACPYCVACLEDSLKSKKVDNLRVLDIAEIAADHL
jgi:Fe-S oxidoreductase